MQEPERPFRVDRDRPAMYNGAEDEDKAVGFSMERKWTELGSVKNEMVKRVSLMKTPVGSRKTGCFLVEGVRSIDELLKAPDFKIEAVFAEETLVQENPGYIRSLGESLPPEVRTYRVSREVFARLSDTQTPQGILASVQRRNFSVRDLEKGTGPALLCILENLQDPGNAGTILRTADSAGADGLICTRGTVDFYSPKVVRSAMGSLLHLPAARVISLSETAAELKSRGIRLAAADLSGDRYHYEEDFTGPTAFLIGNEGSGLSQEALALADVRVKIPMLGRAESLNAGVAAGVLLYEAVRQRSRKQ